MPVYQLHLYTFIIHLYISNCLKNVKYKSFIDFITYIYIYIYMHIYIYIYTYIDR